MSDLSQTWFAEALKLECGQSLLILVLSKKEQTAFANEMEEEKAAYMNIEPVYASQFIVSKLRKDARFWVVVKRKEQISIKGFIKDQDGKYTEIAIDPYRRRMITLMMKDGYTKDMIIDNLGELTDAEEKEFFPAED